MADIQAQLPDGTILNFPEGTPDNVIDNAVRQQLAAQPKLPVQAARADPTAAGIPTFEGLPGFEGRIDPNRQQIAPQRPRTGPSVSERLLSAADRTGGQVAQALTTLAGLPVDAVTAAINIASEATTGQPLLDPEQQAFGRASVERFGAGTQAGVRTVGRGVGLVAPQTPEQRQAERARADESLAFAAGELLGEVAPFVGPAGAIGALSLVPRVIATGLLGATEGGIVSTGRGATSEEALQTAGIGGGLGVTLEIVSPIVGRVANSIFRRATGRAPTGQLVDANLNPTDEFLSVLDDAGLTIEDVQGQVLQEVRKGAIPEQAERAARFQAQGIPTTKGVITQDDILLGREETLLGRIDEFGGRAVEPLRELKKAQSAAFIRNANEIIEDLGLPEDVGNSLKDALGQRKRVLRKQKNKLYEIAGRSDPELARVPILTDNIVDALPTAQKFRQIKRLKPTETAALEDLLIEFGLDQDPAKVDRFLKGADNEISPLSFSNFEDFRQALNAINRSDQTGTIANLATPIINVLDKELDVAFEAMSKSPNIQAKTLDRLKRARSKVVELKTEFDPKGTTNKIISSLKGSRLPTIETSNVYKAIAAPSVSKEAVQRVVRSLTKSGKKGRAALADLQAATVMEALDKAISATSNRSGGVQQFSATAFVNELKKIDGKGNKLDIIFGNNKGMLKTLRNLEKSARETVTPGTTKPKGSAPAVNAVLSIASGGRNIFGLQSVTNAIEAGTLSAGARGALDVTPQQRKTIEFITREYPALATVLGVGVAAQGETDDNQ